MREPFFKIKELLPELCSADLELVILDSVKLIRKRATEETFNTIRLSFDPKIREQLTNKKE